MKNKKRQYTKVKSLEDIIVQMAEAGKTRKEIADELGLANKIVVKNAIYRRNRIIQKMEPAKPKAGRGSGRLQITRNWKSKTKNCVWKMRYSDLLFKKQRGGEAVGKIHDNISLCIKIPGRQNMPLF